MPLHNQRLTGGLGVVDSWIVRITKYISYVSAVCLVGIMLVAFFNVLGEKILHHGVPGSTEIVEYLHVPVVFLSAAYVTLDRGQTAIDLLYQHFPKALQKIASTFSYLLGAAISGFVSYRGFVQMGKHINTHAKSAVSGFGFVLWPFSLVFSIGFAMIAITFLWSIVRLYAKKVDIAPADGEEEGGQPA
jgi:TRAP-type C4-dicarboxylate transport system permease small subunit